MLNNVLISINYVTNFKLNSFVNENLTFSYKNKKNIITCKNFFLFMYLLSFMEKKRRSIKIFLKPRRVKLETILRPPYRHKISRHQLSLNRYYFLICFCIPLQNTIFLKNLNQISFFLNEIHKYLYFFESNLCYTHSYKIKCKFYFNDFFKLMNYKR